MAVQRFLGFQGISEKAYFQSKHGFWAFKGLAKSLIIKASMSIFVNLLQYN